jgi:anti-anti-sigma factor
MISIKSQADEKSLELKIVCDDVSTSNIKDIEMKYKSILEKLAPRISAIIVDLSEINNIDSTGIGMLVRMHLESSKKNIRLFLKNTHPRLLDILKKTNLDKDFNFI